MISLCSVHLADLAYLKNLTYYSHSNHKTTLFFTGRLIVIYIIGSISILRQPSSHRATLQQYFNIPFFSYLKLH